MSKKHPTVQEIKNGTYVEQKGPTLADALEEAAIGDAYARRANRYGGGGGAADRGRAEHHHGRAKSFFDKIFGG